MTSPLALALLWFAAIGCGLMAGVYFAFSTFIMAALGRVDPPAGMAAMVSINAVILRSAFLPLFFATSFAALVLLVVAAPALPQPAALLTAGGALIYLSGMFACTLIFNVPLNNALAAAFTDPEKTAVWARYLRDWTMWNHIRTASSTLSTLLLIAALTLR